MSLALASKAKNKWTTFSIYAASSRKIFLSCKVFIFEFIFIELGLLMKPSSSSLEREVWGSNLGPVKLNTVLPTTRHRCDISSKEAMFFGRNDAKIGPADSLHASAYYSEYNERFDLNSDSNGCTWVQVRVQKNYFFEFAAENLTHNSLK